MLKAEKEWQARVRDLGCIICRNKLRVYSPASIHHAETGAGGRRDHMKVLPLCPRHHTGKDGIHFLGRKAWYRINGNEQDLLLQIKIMLRAI